MKKTVKIFLLISVPFIILGCILFYLKFSIIEKWEGFYYPDGCLTCQDDYIYSPTFEDRASCLSWATTLKSKRGNPNDTFECGKNCKPPDRKSGLYVCDETVDF